MRLAQPDWLAHRLTVDGPGVDAFRAAVAGPGVVPWHHDADRLAEDWFFLLLREPRTLSADGARVLARQLRDAVWEEHERTLASLGVNGCPFDLHRIDPVPQALLRRGPDDAQTLDWLWRHWGTTWPLRRVTLSAAPFLCHFVAADWTPWPAIATLRSRFPGLRIVVKPIYQEQPVNAAADCFALGEDRTAPCCEGVSL